MARMGMDVDLVESIGGRLKNESQSIENTMRQIESLISQAMGAWEGQDASRFQDEWNSQHRPNLQNAAQAILNLGTTALRNASQQRDVSNS